MAGMELPEYLKGKTAEELQRMAEKVKAKTKPEKPEQIDPPSESKDKKP